MFQLGIENGGARLWKKGTYQHVKNYEKGQYSYFQLLNIKNVERVEGHKGWLKRAEGHNISGVGHSAPLFWSSWNTDIDEEDADIVVERPASIEDPKVIKKK